MTIVSPAAGAAHPFCEMERVPGGALQRGRRHAGCDAAASCAPVASAALAGAIRAISFISLPPRVAVTLPNEATAR